MIPLTPVSRLLVAATLFVLSMFWTSARAEIPEVELRVDTASQVDGGAVFRHVENFWHHKGKWKGIPEGTKPDPQWLRERTEGVIRFMSGDYGMANARKIFKKTEDGRFVFSPPPKFLEMLDDWSGQRDVGIWMNLGTNAIPAPLIEGGYKTDTYGYNVRQPKDYDAYYDWLISFFEFIVERYGHDEVSKWVFQFGFEADWQTKFLIPGTQELMDKKANRAEFIKLLDYFHAAAEEVIGEGVAVACYWALITQANDYFRHWSVGTNHKTGEQGTRIAFVGLSDWYHIGPKPAGKWYDPDTFKMSPFTMDQSGKGNVMGNAYVGGLKFKYNYLLRLIGKYPEMDHLQFYVPESGYIQVGSAHPAPLTFADQKGAALYALRAMAFADSPRVIMVGNNFSLSTGDRGAWWRDAAKPPVFNIQRIAMRMNGQRILPVSPDVAEAPTEIRAVASAEDPGDGTQTIRFMTSNFWNFFHKMEAPNPDHTRRVKVILENLPDVESVEVTAYPIDRERNNWWNDYIQWREEEGIEFATSGYGVWAKYDPVYAKHVNDPMGTLRPEDRERWLAKSAEIAKNDALKFNTAPANLPVVDGRAELSFELAESGTMYFEVRYAVADPVAGQNLDFSEEWKRWRRSGTTELVNGQLLLRGDPLGSEVRQVVSNLPPNTPVTFSAEARTSARNFGGRLFAEYPGGEGRVESFLPRSAQWERIVVSTVTDERGELVLGMSADRLRGEAYVEVRSMSLQVSQ